VLAVEQEEQFLALVLYCYNVYGTCVWKIFKVQFDVCHRGDLYQYKAAYGKQVFLQVNYIGFIVLQKDGFVACGGASGRIYVYKGNLLLGKFFQYCAPVCCNIAVAYNYVGGSELGEVLFCCFAQFCGALKIIVG
jgi:hypothetical protein